MRTELYAKDAKGNIRVWKVHPTAFGFNMVSGLLMGKQTTKFVEVLEGKANRTIEQQIELEMNSRIKRKLDSGFVDNIDEAETIERTNNLGFVRPMLAKPKYTEYNKKNSFVQIKYNGLRCMIKNIGGVKYAYSKSGILYPAVTHIQDFLDIPEGVTIDGELYCHGVPLQTINSWVKKEQQQTVRLEYKVYDMVSDESFDKRLENLHSYGLCDYAQVVPTWNIANINIVEKMEAVREDGYEGLIVRQPGFGYQSGKRNNAMIKIKQFLDAEFTVRGMSLSRDGFPMLHLKSSTGIMFKVTAPGSHEEKRFIFANLDKYINKKVTVEFDEFSTKGVPQRCVAKHFRDFE